jgi:hypothetical protein
MEKIVPAHSGLICIVIIVSFVTNHLYNNLYSVMEIVISFLHAGTVMLTTINLELFFMYCTCNKET